jgi:ABC-type bacteriocin/lantibiotic exporters, contain an N-terminal double-glycine peptidase domain
LPQEIFLVDGTLKENIALGEDLLEIREEDVRKAIVKSSLENFVNELPNGIDTLIGERGARISGGQRQRVALARAFYHERSVLVMDESTSALDDKTEEEIIRSISSLKGDTTTIIIAHRVSTLTNCDLIIKMHEGKIIEQGSYNEIIGKGSLDVQ